MGSERSHPGNKAGVQNKSNVGQKQKEKQEVLVVLVTGDSKRGTAELDYKTEPFYYRHTLTPSPPPPPTLTP